MVHAGQSNVLDTARILRGDTETAFRDAYKVITTKIETHRVHQGYLEPRGVIAMLDGDGLSLIMSTQQPFGMRMVLSELFDIPISRIEIKVPAVLAASCMLVLLLMSRRWRWRLDHQCC